MKQLFASLLVLISTNALAQTTSVKDSVRDYFATVHQDGSLDVNVIGKCDNLEATAPVLLTPDGSLINISMSIASTGSAGYLTAADYTRFSSNTAPTFSPPLVDTAGNVTCNVASGSQAGCLASADFTTFNNKQSALTIGNLSDAGTDGIIVTNGTGAVIGSGTSFAQHIADATHNGYLSSANWSTFNTAASSVSAATASNTPSTIMMRDGSGQVAATTFTGALAGNATTATSATTATTATSATTAGNLSGTPALPNGVTATTQTAQDNSTKLATTAYVDALSSPSLGSPLLFDEFEMGTATQSQTGFLTAVSGTSAAIASTTAVVDANHPGVWLLRTGTTSTGIAALKGGQSYIFGSSTVYQGGNYQWVNLSTSTDEYTFKEGYGTSIASGADFTDGISWEYHRAYTFTCVGVSTNSSGSLTGLGTCTGAIDPSSMQVGATITDSKSCFQANTTITVAPGAGTTATISPVASSSGCGSADTFTINASNFWIAKTCKASTCSVQVTPQAISVNTWFAPSIVVTNSSAAFSMNNSLVTTIAATIPNTVATSRSVYFYKTAGTTSRDMYIDYYWSRWIFNSARLP